MRAHQKRLWAAGTAVLHPQATSVPGREILVTAAEVVLSRVAQQPPPAPAQQLIRSTCCRHFATTSSAASGAAAGAAAAAGARSAGLASTSGRTTLPELLQLYKQLSKFRLSALVVSTAAAGFVAGGLSCPPSPRHKAQPEHAATPLLSC